MFTAACGIRGFGLWYISPNLRPHCLDICRVGLAIHGWRNLVCQTPTCAIDFILPLEDSRFPRRNIYFAYTPTDEQVSCSEMESYASQQPCTYICHQGSLGASRSDVQADCYGELSRHNTISGNQLIHIVSGSVLCACLVDLSTCDIYYMATVLADA